jgi:hypothetical protein
MVHEMTREVSTCQWCSPSFMLIPSDARASDYRQSERYNEWVDFDFISVFLLCKYLALNEDSAYILKIQDQTTSLGQVSRCKGHGRVL